MSSQLTSSQQIGFGGGCHWCTEAVFQALVGVTNVSQGWISSNPPNDTPSEAVLIDYNEARIPLGVLIDIHCHTHASSSEHAMRKKYRSAIYVMNTEQFAQCETELAKLQTVFTKPLVVQVLQFKEFRLNQERYLNYLQKNPDAPFCDTYIAPKIATLKNKYAKWLN